MTVTIEVLEELVKDAAQARIEAETALAEAEQRMNGLRARIVVLRQEEDALNAVLQRRFPEARAVSEPTQQSLDATPAEHSAIWRVMPRTDAVEKAVAEIVGQGRKYASPGDILALFFQKGRTGDTKDKIGGATAFLNSRGRIHSVGRGQWVPGPAPEADTDTSPE